MSKTHKFTVVSAFVHEGKIRTPKTSIELAERDAKPLLERGKIKLAKAQAEKPAAANGANAKGGDPKAADAKGAAGADAGGKE